MTRKYSAFLAVLFGLILFLPSATFAQTTAPLLKTAYSRIEDQINLKTSLVLRVDLTTIDRGALTLTLDSLCTDLLKERGFDESKIRTTRNEFHVMLDQITQLLEALDAMRTAAGVREIFVIQQSPSDKSIRVVVPGGQKDLFETLLSVGSGTPSSLTPIKLTNGYAFATNSEADAAIYRNFKSATNPLLKRFYQNAPASSIQLFCSSLDPETIYRLAASRLFHKSAGDFTLPPEAKDGQESFKSYFQQFTMVVDLNKLTVQGNFEFTTAGRAESARKSLELLIDALVDNYVTEENLRYMVSPETATRYNLIKLEREFRKAELKAALPRHSGNSLVFELSPDSTDFWSNICVLPLF